MPKSNYGQFFAPTPTAKNSFFIPKTAFQSNTFSGNGWQIMTNQASHLKLKAGPLLHNGNVNISPDYCFQINKV